MFGSVTGRLRVIYIDDDRLNLTVVSHMLECVAADVACFTNVDEALAALQTQAFHVGLIDIHMPQMSGVEFLHQLRRQIGPNRAMPALALTADLSRAERQYRELGFDGFIAKPVTLKTLLGGIVKVLARAAEAKASAKAAPGSPSSSAA